MHSLTCKMTVGPKLVGKIFEEKNGRTFIVKVHRRPYGEKEFTVTHVAKLTNYPCTKSDGNLVPLRSILNDLADLFREKTGKNPLALHCDPRSELYIEGIERPMLDALDQFDPVEEVISDGDVLVVKTLSSYNMTEEEIDDLFNYTESEPEPEPETEPETVIRQLVNIFLSYPLDRRLKEAWEKVVVKFDGNIDKASTEVVCTYRDTVAYGFLTEKGIANTEKAIEQAYKDDPDLWEQAFEYVEENWGAVEHKWWNLFRQTDRELPGWLLVSVPAPEPEPIEEIPRCQIYVPGMSARTLNSIRRHIQRITDARV